MLYTSALYKQQQMNVAIGNSNSTIVVITVSLGSSTVARAADSFDTSQLY